jgi:hypothetical protein
MIADDAKGKRGKESRRSYEEATGAHRSENKVKEDGAN